MLQRCIIIVKINSAFENNRHNVIYGRCLIEYVSYQFAIKTSNKRYCKNKIVSKILYIFIIQ